jgi:glycosyltransferase involved in cell wall biosynthesis
MAGTLKSRYRLMQPTRVLLIVAGIAIGDQVGGAELLALQIARLLKSPEFEIGVFSIWKYGSVSEAQWIEILKRENIYLGGMTPLRSGLLRQGNEIMASFWRACNEFNPDVINSHSQRGDPLCILARYLHSSHPLAIRTSHLAQPWREQPLLVTMQRLFYPFWFDREVAISKTIQQNLDRRLTARILRKQCSLIYNGIDEELIKNASFYTNHSPPQDVPLEKPCLVIVGRLTRQKGHEFLLEALQIVIKAHPVHLLIMGRGPLENVLRRKAEILGISPYVHFLGSRANVLQILPHTSALVSSSLWEGLPTVLLEAMALEVPVIATDIPGNRELVANGKTGILVPAKEPQKLAQAILWAITHEAEIRDMAQTARGSIYHYTMQNSASAHAQLYQMMLKH